MAAILGSGASRSAYPWRQRLHAWWEGFDLPDPDAVRAAAARKLAETPAAPLSQQVDRLAISQLLWGTGFLEPGGPEHIMTLVKPFGLNQEKSMVDLSAGLGGPTRHVSHEFDVYITGLERVPEIAERGMTMSVDLGVAKKALIRSYDPEKLELRAGGFDCALAQQLLYGVEDKDGFLRQLNQALKPRGHFAFTDYVLLEGAEAPEAMAAWKSSERVVPHPWTKAQYQKGLAATGFDLRVTEDLTETYRSQIAEGWNSLIQRVDLRRMPKPEMLALMDEAELWIRRLNALNAGALGVMRFYALSTKTAMR
jgi:SAM-dependent methyltransferase